MNIDLLYFDGCPTHPAACEMIDEVVADLGVEAMIRHVNVRTDEQAAELGFLGSPSIRVDGVDIDPGAAGRTDFGRRCRVYPGDDGFSGLPPRNWLEAALRGEEAAVDGVPVQDAGPVSCSRASCCEGAQAQNAHEVVLLVADWCPQCPAARSYWSALAPELGFDLQIIDIGTPDGAAFARRRGIRALPTAVVDDVVLGAGVARPDRALILEALDG
jgi:hypothetical protein